MASLCDLRLYSPAHKKRGLQSHSAAGPTSSLGENFNYLDLNGTEDRESELPNDCPCVSKF